MELDPNQIINDVRFTIWTGGDDCRSDSCVYADIFYRDSRPTDTGLLKGVGITWDNNSSVDLIVQLLEATPAGDIDHINIRFQQGGSGWNGDNWNMQAIDLWAPLTDTTWALLYQNWGNPLKRFTGSDTLYTCPWNVPATSAQQAKMLKVRQAVNPIQVFGREAVGRSAKGTVA